VAAVPKAPFAKQNITSLVRIQNQFTHG